MRISDWRSDVCSSDLAIRCGARRHREPATLRTLCRAYALRNESRPRLLPRSGAYASRGRQARTAARPDDSIDLLHLARRTGARPVARSRPARSLDANPEVMAGMESKGGGRARRGPATGKMNTAIDKTEERRGGK